MPTEKQKSELLSKLRTYRKKYLVEKYQDLDESATRIMVNNFLVDVLGYQELEEVKTEYAIKGTYADYVIQVDRKKRFIVEVKSIQLDLSENHIRQAINYAANEGIDWVLLTNGQTYQLYRVVFGKPITEQKVCDINLRDEAQIKESIECFMHLTRKAAQGDGLEKFWKHFQTLEPRNLAKHVQSIEFIKLLKKRLRQKTGIVFHEEDIVNALHKVIATKLEIGKPDWNSMKKQSQKKQLSANSSPEAELKGPATGTGDTSEELSLT